MAELSARRSVCLNMIVRDVAECVEETLASVVGHINSWVVVDTGSADGTVEVITAFMERAGIPGEMHHRPWRDFATNRNEALDLARAGGAEWIWVMDGDDILVGDPGLAEAIADDPEVDAWMLRFGPDFTYWRTQIVRSANPWRYVGVVHEYLECDEPVRSAHLPGEHHVKYRSLGSRSRDPERFHRDAELLRAALADDPTNTRNAFYLAQSLRDDGNLASARDAYLHRAAMGGWTEEVYYSLFRAAECAERLGEDMAEVSRAYERAAREQPARAEALVAAARTARLAGQPDRALELAVEAVGIPRPDDGLFVDTGVHRWRAREELAAAYQALGRTIESIGARDVLLTSDQLRDHERDWIEAARDAAVAERGDSTVGFPRERIAALPGNGGSDAPVTLTITSCRRPELFERTVNSFINCCDVSDLAGITRWICVDNGSAGDDRARLAERYPFFEWVYTESPAEGHVHSMRRLRELVDTRLWLHLEDDWEFFAPRAYVSDAEAILDSDPAIGQVVFNRGYATEPAKRHNYAGDPQDIDGGPDYLLHRHIPVGTSDWDEHLASLTRGQLTNAHWPHFSLNPSLIDTARLAPLDTFDQTTAGFEFEFAARYTRAGLRTAFFPQVNSVHIGRVPESPGEIGGPSAYELTGGSRYQPGYRVLDPLVAGRLAKTLQTGMIDGVVGADVNLWLDPDWPVVAVGFRSAMPVELEIWTSATSTGDTSLAAYLLRFDEHMELIEATGVEPSTEVVGVGAGEAAIRLAGEVVAAWVADGELRIARILAARLGSLAG